MFATKPKTAAEMASKMSSKDFTKLPEKVKKKKASTVSTMLAALREMGK
jgi:hypothetical protein